MAASIYIVQRYGVPIYFGTIPSSNLNLKLDPPLIAAGLYSLHQFGLKEATTKILRTTLLYKKRTGKERAAATLTFHDFQEADTIRVNYGGLDPRERLSKKTLGEADDSTIEFELDLQGISIDFSEVDLSETSLRTTSFLRGLLSSMATEFQRDIINVCRRGLSYTQYTQDFERRIKQVLERVSEELPPKRINAVKGLLRDYETVLEMQLIWKPNSQTADINISLQKKQDFGVTPNILALVIVASRSMLGEIFEPLFDTDIEFIIMDLENEHRVFIAYQKNQGNQEAYSVMVYRATEIVSSYVQEETILEDVRQKLPHGSQ